MEKITTWEVIFGSGLGLFFLKEVLWNSYKKNKDRIDNGIVDAVKKHEEAIIEMQKWRELADYKILAVEGHSEMLTTEFKNQTSAVAMVNETMKVLIKSVESQTKESIQQHKEIQTIISRNTTALEGFIIKLNK